MRKLLTGLVISVSCFSSAFAASNGDENPVVTFGVMDPQSISKIAEEIKTGELVCVKHIKKTYHITEMSASNYSVYDLTVQNKDNHSIIFRSGDWLTDEPVKAIKESGLSELAKCHGFSKSHRIVFGE